MITQLNEMDVNAQKQVGGKGKNLILLKRAGFNIPDGFVIDFEAYEAYVQSSNIASTIE